MLKVINGYHYPLDIYTSTHDNGGFTILTMDVSSKYNYNCDWCCNKSITNKEDKGMLTSAERVDFLRKSMEMGAKTLVILGAGEPTLDKGIYDLIEGANSFGFISVLYTNLSGNINEDKIKFLYDNNASIIIKMDSLNKDYFLNNYHVNETIYSKFSKNLDSVLSIYANSKKKSTNCDIYRVSGNMVITHINKVEVEHISNFCNRYDVPLFVRPVRYNQYIDVWDTIGNIDGTKQCSKELESIANRYCTLFAPSSTLKNHCSIYSFGLTLKNNGDIVLCPDSDIKYGNVKDVDIKEMMRSLREKRTIQPGFCPMISVKGV